MSINIVVAGKEHYKYAEQICGTIYQSAIVRGTGIAKRTPEYIQQKMNLKQAVIATVDGNFAGFCYIETWQHAQFVVHSGLIVHPDYRSLGLAKKIKNFLFDYTRQTYPNSKIFGITTGLAVMKINSELGYRPVTFSELTDDPLFWNGCKTCTNFNILQSKGNKMCLCTGMLFDPNAQKNNGNNGNNGKENKGFNNKVLLHLKKVKQLLLLKRNKNNTENK